eukprot:6205087-Pleurochrysis_carterae.AAC.1
MQMQARTEGGCGRQGGNCAVSIEAVQQEARCATRVSHEKVRATRRATGDSMNKAWRRSAETQRGNRKASRTRCELDQCRRYR